MKSESGSLLYVTSCGDRHAYGSARVPNVWQFHFRKQEERKLNSAKNSRKQSKQRQRRCSNPVVNFVMCRVRRGVQSEKWNDWWFFVKLALTRIRICFRIRGKRVALFRSGTCSRIDHSFLAVRSCPGFRIANVYNGTTLNPHVSSHKY